MEKLLKGVVHFRKSDFEAHKELFSELESGQHPHTLFIGCSDSRVVPHMITQTLPGELFIIRNIANMVPRYRIADEYLSTTSGIEYAVKALEVETIVVCGHSNCGGCALIHQPVEAKRDLPNASKWLELASSVKEQVNRELPDHNDEKARAWLTEQMNVLEQLKHLLTYPYIKEKVINGKLQLLGWHYIISTGEVYQYDKEQESFVLLNSQ
ncbi:MAG: carbonic anhydrase [Spirochaetales bacterium]|nr:carbonic anhydrase [Spirochaetales bacterium]